MSLADRHMHALWEERRCRVEGEEPLIPGWPRGYPSRPAVLLPAIKVSYQWDLEMEPIPVEFIHWMHNKIQTNKKKAKYSIS